MGASFFFNRFSFFFFFGVRTTMCMLLASFYFLRTRSVLKPAWRFNYCNLVFELTPSPPPRRLPSSPTAVGRDVGTASMLRSFPMFVCWFVCLFAMAIVDGEILEFSTFSRKCLFRFFYFSLFKAARTPRFFGCGLGGRKQDKIKRREKKEESKKSF